MYIYIAISIEKKTSGSLRKNQTLNYPGNFL